jgi:hypothetical protein
MLFYGKELVSNICSLGREHFPLRSEVKFPMLPLFLNELEIFVFHLESRDSCQYRAELQAGRSGF